MQLLQEIPELELALALEGQTAGLPAEVLPPFADEVLSMLAEFSTRLLADPAIRDYPDLASLAFFCRARNLEKMRANSNIGDTPRLGRGLAFHIAPSNVAVNFAYSLIVGLLAGNTNIVRLPTKRFTQVEAICRAISDTLSKRDHAKLAGRIMLVRYPRECSATEIISRVSDVRLIWGGDQTISTIRRIPTPPRCCDITFADRYSLAVIDAAGYLRSDRERVARAFFNDTYVNDQAACTAPHLVVWLGSTVDVAQAKREFWSALLSLVKQSDIRWNDINGVDKFTAFCGQAIAQSIRGGPVENDNALWVAELNALPANVDECRVGRGFFLEFQSEDLSPLVPIINSRYQTLAYFGVAKEALRAFVLNNRLTGIDRVIPVGRTMEFSLHWDGYDLIHQLSRECVII